MEKEMKKFKIFKSNNNKVIFISKKKCIQLYKNVSINAWKKIKIKNKIDIL